MEEDLIGCLCGVSNSSQEDAEHNALALNKLVYVVDWNEDEWYYSSMFNDRYAYACPVKAEILEKVVEKTIEQIGY